MMSKFANLHKPMLITLSLDGMEHLAKFVVFAYSFTRKMSGKMWNALLLGLKPVFLDFSALDLNTPTKKIWPPGRFVTSPLPRNASDNRAHASRSVRVTTHCKDPLLTEHNFQ